MCALDNATDLHASALTNADDSQAILDTAEVFLGWLQNPGKATAVEPTRLIVHHTPDTPTPHPFVLGAESVFPRSVWMDEAQLFRAPRHCGAIHPHAEVPPCQLPATHVGQHASFVLEEATRHDWMDEAQVEASRRGWWCGESHTIDHGRPIGKQNYKCSRRAGHEGNHQAGVQEWPQHHEAKATCPAMEPMFGTDSYHYCNLTKGHGGDHQNGTVTWA